MANDIQQLVFAFFNMEGVPCKEEDQGVWTADIPEKERSFFNCDSKIRFTFDREKAELHRDIEMICEGSFLLRKILERLSTLPKVSRLFAGNQPQTPEASGIKSIASKMHYKTSVAFNFKVTIDCDTKTEKLFSVVESSVDSRLEVKDNLFYVDLNYYSEKPDPRIKLDEAGPDVLKVYLEACQKLEDAVQNDIAEARKLGVNKCREDMKVFDAYLDEQKAELIQKKENVSFHLYFFQKEEEIDKLIGNLEEERKRKLTELEEKYKVKVDISLINAVLLCIPESGSSKSSMNSKGARIVKLNSVN